MQASMDRQIVIRVHERDGFVNRISVVVSVNVGVRNEIDIEMREIEEIGHLWIDELAEDKLKELVKETEGCINKLGDLLQERAKLLEMFFAEIRKIGAVTFEKVSE
jgi:hypothetical protein